MTRPTRDTTTGRVYLDLRRKAQAEARATDELLVLHVLERFLYRLSISPYRDRPVLKGGMLLAAFDERRPTRDVDLLGLAITNDAETITALVAEITAIEVDDGVTTGLEQTTGQRWQFSVGFPITEPVRNAIRALRCGKDTGMRTLPCDTFDRNALWLQLVLLAQDLMTFTQLLTLEEGELRSAEPQQLQAAAHPRPHHPPRPRGAARHPTQLPVAPMISPWQVGWVFTATPSTDVIRPPGDSVGIGPRAQGAPLASARGHDPS